MSSFDWLFTSLPQVLTDMVQQTLDKQTGKILLDLSLGRREQMGEFFGELKAMARYRGWRAKDKIILLLTVFIHLILFPVRFMKVAFRASLSGTSTLQRARQSPLLKIAEWLDSVGLCPIFDCVAVGSEGLMRLRRGIDPCMVANWAREELIPEIFVPKEGEVVVDVGAHIGRYTLRASRLVGDKGKVIAVEAEPSNFAALLYNLKLNEANNVIPLDLAAWDCETTLELYIETSSTTHSLVRPRAKSIEVKARPLDNVLEELGVEKVDWLKIDVEGAEVEVLRGLEKTLSQNPNLKLLVEIHSDETLAQCLSILEKPGYEIRGVQRHLLATPITGGG